VIYNWHVIVDFDGAYNKYKYKYKYKYKSSKLCFLKSLTYLGYLFPFPKKFFCFHQKMIFNLIYIDDCWLNSLKGSAYPPILIQSMIIDWPLFQFLFHLPHFASSETFFSKSYLSYSQKIQNVLLVCYYHNEKVSKVCI